jgi:hypothetical protein
MKITSHKDFLSTVDQGINYCKNILFEHPTFSSQILLYSEKNYFNIIDKLNFDVVIEDETSLTKFDFDNLYFCPTYNIGYYPVKLTIFHKNDTMVEQEFDIESFKQITNVNKVIIRFSTSYNINGYTNTIKCPNVIYHLTSEVNEKNITEKGFIGQNYSNSNDFVSRHLTYLFFNKEDVEDVKDFFKNIEQNTTKLLLYEIETNNRKYIDYFNDFWYNNEKPYIQDYRIIHNTSNNKLYYTTDLIYDIYDKITLIQRDII